jgi:perosamine synthetase
MTQNDGSRLAEEVVAAICSVVGSGPVALHEPDFSGNEWHYLKECLDSTFVSSIGKFVDRFEAELVEYTGSKHAIAVVNGTAALHIALQLAGVMDSDEVLVPALTFVATANAVSYCGATPHFVDIEKRTLGVDPDKLRSYLSAHTEQSNGQCINSATGRVIRAIVPVHTFGHPAGIDEIISVAHDFGIALVEDAAESLGSFYKGRHTGTFGLLGVLSFNGNKTITCGGGGAILTDSAELAARAKHLTTTAKLAHTWDYYHDEIGYNYRMPNLNAALGCAQLERLPALLERKRELFAVYSRAFASIKGIDVIAEPENSESNYWLQTLRLDASHAMYRDQILELTNHCGYGTRPVWRLINTLKPYRECPAMDLETAEVLARALINIPSSASLAGSRCE